MTAPRLSEVTACVVAWHNRHPLARRIDPTQVHSIGEVRLPFASAAPFTTATDQPRSAAQPVLTAPPAPAAPAPPVPPAGPSLAEALAQRTARQHGAASAAGSAIDGLAVQSMLPDTADDLLATAAPASAAPDSTNINLALDASDPNPPRDPQRAQDGEAAPASPAPETDRETSHTAADTAADTAGETAPPNPQNPVEPVDHDAPSATAAAGTDAAEVYPPPHGQVPSSALARAVERRAAARGGAGAAQDPSDGPVAQARSTAAPGAAGAAATGRWQRLAQALRTALTGRQPGMPPLRAAFSQDFIWPLRPGQVARWAQRHGQLWPLAPTDWPRRQVDTDRTRLATLRQKGLTHDLQLHVLSAAIGVGDRRMRVLLGADGSIIGPRAYNHARVGTTTLLLALGLVGAGWSLRPLHGGAANDGAAAIAALPASTASAASTSSAASASSASMAALPASAPASAVLASATEAPVSGADGEPSAHLPRHADAASAAGNSDANVSEAKVSEAGGDAVPGPAADIRPSLSDDQKYAARAQAAKLRGDPPPPEALQGPVYAVVSAASRQRENAASSLALMQSAAAHLAGTVPEHGELVQSHGQWRAAWWPFTNLVDAERARVLLAGRGLKADVVEF